MHSYLFKATALPIELCQQYIISAQLDSNQRFPVPKTGGVDQTPLCTASHIGKGGNVPKRAYYCELCGMYHLNHLKYSIDYTDGGHKPNKQEKKKKNADFNSKVFSTIKKGNIDISDFDID